MSIVEASVRCDAKVGNAVQLDSHVRYAGVYSPFAGVMFCRLTLVTATALGDPGSGAHMGVYVYHC